MQVELARAVSSGPDRRLRSRRRPSGRELLDVVAATVPDVVLTDLAMPDLDGATATRELLAGHPGHAVIVLTMHDDDESVFAAMRAGAPGYLLKGADGPELMRAVLAVPDGDAVYEAAVARRIVSFYSDTHQRYAAHAFPDLTPRERDVLDLLAGGARNHEIARRLSRSEKTVCNRVSAVLLKLQVPDRAAAAHARDAGLGT
jgi:DNA-binding NarL/FixJ family response regulator